MNKFVLTSLALFSIMSFKAQDAPSAYGSIVQKTALSGMSVSFNYGALVFVGDVKQNQFFSFHDSKKYGISEINSGYELTINKKISKVFALEGQILQGKLSGLLVDKKEYFQANTLAYTLNVLVNINKAIFNQIGDNKANLYWRFGIGFVDFRSARKVLGTQSPSSDDGVIQYFGYENSKADSKAKKTTEVTVPLGIGYSYPINSKFRISIDRSVRFVNTDKLDSKIFLGDNDLYTFTSIGLSFQF